MKIVRLVPYLQLNCTVAPWKFRENMVHHYLFFVKPMESLDIGDFFDILLEMVKSHVASLKMLVFDD